MSTFTRAVQSNPTNSVGDTQQRYGQMTPLPDMSNWRNRRQSTSVVDMTGSGSMFNYGFEGPNVRAAHDNPDFKADVRARNELEDALERKLHPRKRQQGSPHGLPPKGP